MTKEETKSPNISIRRASVEDASSMASVLLEAFEEFRPLYTPGGFEATTPTAQQIKDRADEGPAWVALQGERVVGTVSAIPEGEALYIRSMAVVPSARGQRTGEELLRRAEEFAYENGLTSMFLSTTPFLARAIRLYERAGFQRPDSKMGDLHGTPVFKMVKPLRASSESASQKP